MLAPIIGIVLYPRANWLFAFTLVGIAILLFTILARKDPTAQALADRAEAMLSGSYGGWDVDDYEHMNPRDPKVRNLWQSTMAKVIPRLRQLSTGS
jgi:hypothetical protein